VTQSPARPSAPPPKTCGLAVAGLVVGLLGLCTAGLGGIVGLVLSLLALRRIDASGGKIGGRSLAQIAIGVSAAMILIGFVVSGLPVLGLLIVFRDEIREGVDEIWEESRAGEGAEFLAAPAGLRLVTPRLRLAPPRLALAATCGPLPRAGAARTGRPAAPGVPCGRRGP